MFHKKFGPKKLSKKRSDQPQIKATIGLLNVI